MSKSHRLSSASATCRLEWRPSKLIVAWLILLAVLSPVSLLSSALPRWLAWPLAFAAALWALRGVFRYLRHPRHVLRVAVDGSWEIDGAAVEGGKVRWRGPLAFVAWRDGAGRSHALSFWPDTLAKAARRELRLATPNTASVSPAAVMAT